MTYTQAQIDKANAVDSSHHNVVFVGRDADGHPHYASSRGIREKFRQDLRVQYREAGMSEDAIQAMYEFDLGVLNSERAYITNTMTVSGAADDCAAKETSDFKQYEKAVTVTDTYHETKSRFAWIGEIENEQLLTALETLKVEDLEIITMYAYEGYDITEISKVYGVSRPTISIKIKRITKFLKNFNFNATN